MITIHLSKSEAKICRIAGCADVFSDAGEVRMSRPAWWEAMQALEGLGLDFEKKYDLSVRKAAETLAERIEGVLDRYDQVNRVAPKTEPAAPAGCLF